MMADAFELRLRDALARPLPGVTAQMRLAPSPRVGWDPAVIPPGLRDAAGLILLYPHDGEWWLPLTVRAASLRSHTGQVSLPGGRVDEGESVEGAALREACEEIGVAPAYVRVLGRLTPLHIPVSRHLLYPIVGMTDQRPELRPAEQEVARVLEVSLAMLANPASVHYETWMRTIEGASIAMEVPYFGIDGERVWGATGMVLAELRALVESLRRAPSA